MPSAGVANDASTAAADCARSSSMPWASASSISCGLMPAASVSARMSRPATVSGTWSVSSKPKAPSRSRASSSSAKSSRRLTAMSRAAGGSVASRGSGAGECAVKAETTSPSRKTMAPSPSSMRTPR